MSGGRPFFDTNILVYATIGNDPRSQAAQAILGGGGTISVQILNEFVHVARRKLGKSWAEIEKAVVLFSHLLEPPSPLTLDIHRAAFDMARRHGLNFYDSLVIAAAAHAKCSVLYTEDMQDGRSLAGVTIRNPFV